MPRQTAAAARPSGFGPAWLRVLLLLVFAGLNALAFACPAAMPGPVAAQSVMAADASAAPCHDVAAEPATVDGTTKPSLPDCCGASCAPAVQPLFARFAPALLSAPAQAPMAVHAALAGAPPSTEKPPPRTA